MKTLFFCKHCLENQYGRVDSDGSTYGGVRIRIIQCEVCEKYTDEETNTAPPPPPQIVSFVASQTGRADGGK